MASIAPSQCNETTADPQVDVDTNQSEKPHDNLTDHLPIEIVLLILSLLGPKDLCKVSLLNSLYRNLADDNALWKPLCALWGIEEVRCGNWKEVCKKARQDQVNMFKRIEEARTTRKHRGATWTVKKGALAIIKDRPCKVIDIHYSRPGYHGQLKMLLVGTDLVTGKKCEQIYRQSQRVSPVNHPRSTITEYLLIDLNVEAGNLSLVDSKTGETRTIPVDLNDGEGKGAEVHREWVTLQPNQSLTVRVLDITWCNENGNKIKESVIMDTRVWKKPTSA